MSIRETYHQFEDGWYNLLDAVDQKVPVYAVVDPIERVVPTFAILLGIIAVLLLGGVFVFLAGGNATSATLLVLDEDGKPVEGAILQATWENGTQDAVTNAVGKATFNGLPKETPIQMRAEHELFSTKTSTYTLEENNLTLTLTLSLSKAAPSMLTFYFVDKTGMSLEGKALSIQLSCSSGEPLEEENQQTTSGILSTMPPRECGTLMGTISGEGFETRAGVPLRSDTPIIALDSRILEKSQLKVRVMSAEENEAIGDAQVELFSSEGVSIERRYTNGLGITLFENVPQGEYYVSTSTPTGEYAAETTSTISLNTTGGEEITVTLSRATQGTLSVRVTDQITGGTLSNVTLKLLRATDRSVVQTFLTNETGDDALLAVNEKGPFILYALHPNYLSAEKQIPSISGSASVNVVLEQLTAQNSGRIVVKVTDEEGFSVESARVVLYDAASKFILHGYEPKFTNANGEATFVGVKSGNYFARATKYPAGPSDSPIFASSVNEVTQTTVKLTIGTATVRVRVLDEQGEPIPLASVAFEAEGSSECAGNKCRVETDSGGVASYTFKADRKIFARVSAPGYAPYSTISHALKVGLPTTIPVVLPRTISGNAPTIRVATITDMQTGLSAAQLDKGKSYRIMYQLTIPDALSGLEHAGVHVRVGDEALVESENAFILSINAPRARATRGSTFRPLLGWSEDEQNLTDGDAKWANVEWDAVQSGVYELATEIHVKNSATLLENVNVYYRAWGTQGSIWTRAPFDTILGENENASGKEALYANTFTRAFFVGKPISCEDSICYAGETLTNLDTGLIQRDSPYAVIPLNSYRYEFVLAGNAVGTGVLSSAQIRVVSVGENGTSGGAEIQSYAFENVPGNTVQESGLSAFTLEGTNGQGIIVGEISAAQTIRGTIDFSGASDATSEMVMQVIANGDIVFERTLSFVAGGFQNMNLVVSPSTVPAFTSSVLNVRVNDNEGFGMAGVRVRVTKIDASNVYTFIDEKYTDNLGDVRMDVPASLPNSRFRIDASRGSESALPFVVGVGANVVSFSPETLDATLDAVPNADTFIAVDATSLAQQELTLTQTAIAGSFQGLLSLSDMQNWLGQYHGNLHISPGETQGMNVKVSTTPSLSLLAGKNLSGNIITVWENSLNAGTWVQSLPLRVALTIPTQCDGEAIQLSGVSAQGAIELTAFENRVDKPFQLLNVCEVNGNPIDLHDLKAKITWGSQPIGMVELHVRDPNGINEITDVLRNGYDTPLFGTFNTNNGTPYDAILTFIPFPRHVGETANFTVTISAETGSGNDVTLLSQSFDMKINVTNFEACVVFDADPDAGIRIPATDSETTFSIDTTACGQVPIDIAFCTGTGNENCRGGAPEGKIYLSQDKIQKLKGEKTIRVERKASTLPGTYDITVDARVAGTTYRRIAALPLKVEPRESYAFDVDKTVFALFGENTLDTTEVENRLVNESVRVRASKCDWDDSVEQYKSEAFQEWSDIDDVQDYFEGLGGFYKALFGGQELLDFLDDVWDKLTGDDPCDDHSTHELDDFIIKLAGAESLPHPLPPDAINIELSSNIQPYYTAEWVIDNPMLIKEEKKMFEYVGMSLQNVSGRENGLPDFGVMTLRATEHVHTDAFHEGKAYADCSNGRFGPFRVGNSSEQGSCSGAIDKIREEKFHIKINTADTQPVLPLVTFDGLACESPSMAGMTGTNALPRVAFTWNWNEQTGVGAKFCDATNPNAVYCDATQFNIMLQKRLKILDDFMAANQYQFECPDELGEQAESGVYTRPHPLAVGFVGYYSFGYSFQTPSTLSFSGVIQNKTVSPQEATMIVTLTPISPSSPSNPPGGPLACTGQATIAAGEQAAVPCVITDVPTGLYRLTFDLTSATTANVASVSAPVIIDTADYLAGFGNTCEGLLKTTALVGGKPGINRWIDASDPLFGNTINDHPVFTADVPTIDALRQLMHFDAYLMTDGYSIDFENDFRDFYSTNAFADTPPWFKGNGSGTAGFNSYYGNGDALTFTQKYENSPTLERAGKYRVDVDVTYNEEWNLVDGAGQPAATTKVIFYHLQNPSPDSPFYALPFNGEVGLEGNTYHRLGYGIEYETTEEGNVLIEQGAPIKEGEGSSAVRKLSIDTTPRLAHVNSIPSSRGNVLDISPLAGGVDYSLQFTPTLATPLVLKVTQSTSEVPFSLFYGVSSGGTPKETGNTFAYWEGAGVCYDYSGTPVYEAFNYSPDRAATSEDHLPNYQYTYALDWPRAVVGGDVYLRTIVYTPVEETYQFQTRSTNARVFTANYAAPSTNQLLDGVSSMNLNNASSSIQTMQDVFTLVKNNQVCVSNSGTQTKFFWNPAAVYTQPGQVNVSTFVNGLVAGQTCMGPTT